MENKTAENNPDGIAFGIRAYNAKGGGHWIDLLNPNNRTDFTNSLQIGDQFCVRIINNDTLSHKVDLMNLNDAHPLFDINIPFNDIATYKKVRIFSNQVQNIKKVLNFVFKGEGTEGMYPSNGMDVGQFQNGVCDTEFSVPIPFKELQNFYITISPREEAMFYFYND